jgi:hypothetical protein
MCLTFQTENRFLHDQDVAAANLMIRYGHPADHVVSDPGGQFVARVDTSCMQLRSANGSGSRIETDQP